MLNNLSARYEELQTAHQELANRFAMMDEGVVTLVPRIDADLKALDERVDRRRRECDATAKDVELLQRRLDELDPLVNAQEAEIAILHARVGDLERSLEKNRCRCSQKEGKGKGKEVLKVHGSPVLGGPIELVPATSGEESSGSSYVTPPMAGASALSPSDCCDVPKLELIQEDKENNTPRPGIGYYLDEVVAELGNRDEESFSPGNRAIVKAVKTNVLAHRSDIIAVRGQRAVRTLGRPKSLFHPYPTIRRLLGHKFRHESSGDSPSPRSSSEEL